MVTWLVINSLSQCFSNMSEFLLRRHDTREIIPVKLTFDRFILNDACTYVPNAITIFYTQLLTLLESG